MDSSSRWCVYLLSNGSRTYIGSSTDVKRRLRQHNGEIVGGARATSRTPGKWKLICWLSEFENRSVACRWEKILKLRARGLGARYSAMYAMFMYRQCPMHKKGAKHYDVPKELYFHGE